jgi:glycosyltransferase involved in cell wall biosynthesis
MSPPYKVAFLMNGAKPPRGGELLTKNLILSLRRDLFQATVIYAEDCAVIRELQDNNIETFQIKLAPRLTAYYLREAGLINPVTIWKLLTGFFDPRPFAKIIEILQERQVGLLYCADNLSKLVGAIAGWRCGVKIVGHCHDELRHDLLGYTLRALNLLLLDKVIVVSDAVRKAFPRSGMLSSRSVTIGNGIDTRRFNPAQVRPVVLEDWEVSIETVVIGMIGTLDKNRGYIFLLRAAQKLKAEGIRNLKVLIVGQGPEEQALRAYARESGIEKDVRFLGFRQDIPEILKSVSILVIPTLHYESYGMVAAEAMAMEVPVIGTGVGALPELIVHGQTGLLVSPGNEKDLCHALRCLLDHPDDRKVMGANGRVRVLEMFSLEKSMEQIERVFLSCLAQREPEATQLMTKAREA